MAVVTNDAGQRDAVEVSPLQAGENTFSFPPEPQERKRTVQFLFLHDNIHSFTSAVSFTCPRLSVL